MAVVVVATGSWVGYRQLVDAGCTGSVKLNVAAAPEIAGSVDQVAQAWVKTRSESEGTCVSIAVSGVDPATVAGAVIRDHNVLLPGVPFAPAAVQQPDVWVSDSSTWIMRLRKEASGFTPTKVTSVAQSPLVVAMPEAVARQVGWPNAKVSWDGLLKTAKTSAMQIGVVDPTRDATGLGALLSVSSAARSPEQKAQALTLLAQNDSALRDDLLQKFPRTGDPADLATALSAAPLSEEDVVAYNAQRPQMRLAAIYPQPSAFALDYPFALMPQVVEQEKMAAADGLLKELTSPSFRNVLGSAGLRAPDGTYGSGFVAPDGAPAASPAVTASAKPSENSGGEAAGGLDAAALSSVVGGWVAITKPGQVLAVFDISGSMGDPVPTAGGKSKAEVTRAAAQVGLGLFGDQWSVGVWLFSTELDGKKPYRQLVPIQSLATGRRELAQSINEIKPKRLGSTGLYDTVLAAFREAQKKWKQGVSNSVILFTDGDNDNAGGLTQAQLLTALKKEHDPKRPVRLVLIGIGDQVNPAELKAIAGAGEASNSGWFISRDPAQMDKIFFEAIGSRTQSGD